MAGVLVNSNAPLLGCLSPPGPRRKVACGRSCIIHFLSSARPSVCERWYSGARMFNLSELTPPTAARRAVDVLNSVFASEIAPLRSPSAPLYQRNHGKPPSRARGPEERGKEETLKWRLNIKCVHGRAAFKLEIKSGVHTHGALLSRLPNARDSQRSLGISHIPLTVQDV